MRRWWCLGALLGASLVDCAGPPASAPASPETASGGGAAGANGVPEPSVDLRPPFVLRGAKLWRAEAADVLVDDEGTLLFVPGGTPVEAREIDARGWSVFPGFVDSHVHLAYDDVRSFLPAAGVLAALDLAAPLRFLEEPPLPDLDVAWSGPMLTAVAGYPTQGWGRNGYGLELTGVEDARARAHQLLDAGARVLKVPLDGAPSLGDDEVRAIVEVAHARERLVVTHALSDESARRARRLGCDVLAHTPTETLTEETIEAWRDGAVLSTLVAFGNGSATRENLRRLREAGATILYGTDLGNHRTAGLSLSELEALGEAGLSNAEILESATTSPSALFGFAAGRFEDGAPARLVAFRRDPEVDLRVVVEPELVVVGARVLLWKPE